MNEKQKRFVDEYIIHANVYRAAINAGYSENYARTNASKLLAKDSIKDYKDKRLEEMKNKRTADAQEVMEYLTSVMRGEMKDETLLVVPTGDFESEVQRHDQRADTSQRTKAAELLGKRYAMWTEKTEIEHSGAVQFVDDIE
ncbi:terminase small subunit [Jeotgalicoccus halotolerans]|uniref:Phage terminase small subunit n=1 Tax=Jeotgalicoccus halotolerans TaxID=157227 RepID=A0A3E0AZZ9_9STAP|nr:terminase small subunit [Jeotgalicoccus halotolerans]REG25288.1 phage terminase small subunit [Jeotgalicoccus halotolerans]